MLSRHDGAVDVGIIEAAHDVLVAVLRRPSNLDRRMEVVQRDDTLRKVILEALWPEVDGHCQASSQRLFLE